MIKWIILFAQVQIHYFYYSVQNCYYVYVHPFPFSDQYISIAAYMSYAAMFMHMFFSLLATALFAGEKYARIFTILVCLDIVWVANYFARYASDFMLPTFDMISVKSMVYLVVIGLYKARIKYFTYEPS